MELICITLIYVKKKIAVTHNHNESMACFVSRRYMRGENGKDSLVVCLSEYLNLCSV